MNHKEHELQARVCTYISQRYKNVLFLSDTVANLSLTFFQAGRNKEIQKSGFSCPDLIILEPRRGFCGLFIELKVESPFKVNGELRKQKLAIYRKTKYGKIKIGEKDHLEEQQKAINALKGKGYYACFSWGYEMTINIIDEYLKEEN